MTARRRKRTPTCRVGCAGWSIPRSSADSFPGEGSHLQRYAQVFNAAEINSSFHRNHTPAAYRRWAAAVPAGFRFSVKLPRSITHHAKLDGCDDLLRDFLAGVAELGPRLGCLLMQLPPKLAWDPARALPFLALLLRLHAGPVACEPRHASWFQAEAGRALSAHGIARVAADPALSLRARVPGGDRRLQYLRLHGSPRMYYDSYASDTLDRIAARLKKPSADTAERWCIFDNTAQGCATANALALRARLRAA